MKKEDVHFGEFLSSEPNYDAAFEHLRRSVSAICREGRNVDAYYIGKASGPEPIWAIKRRFDDVKIKYMFTEDWALYESSCRHTVDELESALNIHYKDVDKKRFKVEGTSGGAPSYQLKHYIYLCLRRN